MASLVTRLQDLATRIATECKALRTMLNGNAADLSSLTTTAKTNLVAAINEVKALAAAGGGGGASINDASSASATEVWSINKVVQELNDTAVAVKGEILNGAGAAYDTLVELQVLLEGDAAEITALTTALGYRVRFDAAQTLTSGEKAQARANIGADITTAEIGNPDTDFVATFNTGLV